MTALDAVRTLYTVLGVTACRWAVV
jgi:hypothetical protein